MLSISFRRDWYLGHSRSRVNCDSKSIPSRSASSTSSLHGSPSISESSFISGTNRPLASPRWNAALLAPAPRMTTCGSIRSGASTSSCRVNSDFMPQASSATTTCPSTRAAIVIPVGPARTPCRALRCVRAPRCSPSEQMLCVLAAHAGANPHRLRQPRFPVPVVCQRCLRVGHPCHLIRPQPVLRSFLDYALDEISCPRYDAPMSSEISRFSGTNGGASLSTSRITRFPKMASMTSWSVFSVMSFGTVRLRFFRE